MSLKLEKFKKLPKIRKFQSFKLMKFLNRVKRQPFNCKRPANVDYIINRNSYRSDNGNT